MDLLLPRNLGQLGGAGRKLLVNHSGRSLVPEYGMCFFRMHTHTHLRSDFPKFFFRLMLIIDDKSIEFGCFQ